MHSIFGAVNGTVLPEPVVVAMAKRRRFSMGYKRRIVRAAESCKDAGEVGALLRKEAQPRAERRVAWRTSMGSPGCPLQGPQYFALRSRGVAKRGERGADVMTSQKWVLVVCLQQSRMLAAPI